MGRKCPLKTVALVVKLWKEDLGKVENESVRITLQWAGLKVQNGCKNPAIVHGRVRGDVGKQ